MELLKHIDNRKENIYIFKFNKPFYDKNIIFIRLIIKNFIDYMINHFIK